MSLELGPILIIVKEIQGSDGSDHDHWKLLVGKHANKLWYIMKKWSYNTNHFQVYIFLWSNFVQEKSHLENGPMRGSIKCCTFTFLSCLFSLHEWAIMVGWSTEYFFSFPVLSEQRLCFRTQGLHAFRSFVFVLFPRFWDGMLLTFHSFDNSKNES